MGWIYNTIHAMDWQPPGSAQKQHSKKALQDAMPFLKQGAQKVTVRLGSVKEEKVAMASVSA